MWILTQNGKRILSTEGMDEINVANPAEGRTDFAVMLHRRMDGKSFALGFYHKRDNAITILNDILKVQGKFYSCQGEFQAGYVAVPPKIFEMPLDMACEIRGGKEKMA